MSTLLFGFAALPGAWAAPTVVITNPPAGATISELYLPTILLQATATDPDASISYVTFYVCQSINATCDILHLELGPIDLNLLGLVVHVDKIVVDIDAQSGPGNLLGNLLCAIANLLNNNGPVATLVSLLNQILGLL